MASVLVLHTLQTGSLEAINWIKLFGFFDHMALDSINPHRVGLLLFGELFLLYCIFMQSQFVLRKNHAQIQSIPGLVGDLALF